MCVCSFSLLLKDTHTNSQANPGKHSSKSTNSQANQHTKVFWSIILVHVSNQIIATHHNEVHINRNDLKHSIIVDDISHPHPRWLVPYSFPNWVRTSTRLFNLVHFTSRTKWKRHMAIPNSFPVLRTTRQILVIRLFYNILLRNILPSHGDVNKTS